MIFDFDAISRLTKILKEASPRLQAKVCCVLDHVAASEQHATAMTAACTGSVIEAILEIGVIHGNFFFQFCVRFTNGYITSFLCIIIYIYHEIVMVVMFDKSLCTKKLYGSALTWYGLLYISLRC